MTLSTLLSTNTIPVSSDLALVPLLLASAERAVSAAVVLWASAPSPEARV